MPAQQTLTEALGPRVTKAHAARQLGVNVPSIDRMIAQGALKAVDLPGDVRAIVLQSSLDALIARATGGDRATA